MAEENIPGVQLQGDKGPRRFLQLRKNSPVEQFKQRKARPDGIAYLPQNSNTPSFSEHAKYCRLYVSDRVAVQAALELAASKYGVPLRVTGDPEICRILLAEAKKMGITVNSAEAPANAYQAAQAVPSETARTKPIERAAVAQVQHPIANETVIRFIPDNKAKSVIVGKIIESSTGDGQSYRYRVELQSEGRMTVVYSDDGRFEQIGPIAEADIAVEATDRDEAMTPDSLLGGSVQSTGAAPAWLLTKDAYLNDKDRVRIDVGMVQPGYKVDYEYITPGLIGPYASVMLSANKLNVGDTVMAAFGKAMVRKVSAARQDINEHGLIQAGKLHHRRMVVDALMAGKQVPPEVMAGYPEIMPRVNEWTKQQIKAGVALAPGLYNDMDSARGGIIRVSYDEVNDVYDVSHIVEGSSHDHVTGVDADGAGEAARKLLGLVSSKEAPPIAQVSMNLVEMVANHIEPLPKIDLLAMFTKAVEAEGSEDYLAVVQDSLDAMIEQANQKLGAYRADVVKAEPLNQQNMAEAMAFRAWKDNLGFLGDDPAAAAEKWQGLVLERDELIERVSALEEQLKDSADRNEANDQEIELE